MDDDKIQCFMQEHGGDWIKWYKNPPLASIMGDVWERQIRSARAILSSLLKTHGQSLDDESLITLMTEVEGILNSRPLTVETINDPTSFQPLSRINPLTMKSKVVSPPQGKFLKPDVFSRRRWRRIQHIANKFWSRSRKEYFQSLQKRQKWTSRRRNFRVDDIAMLKQSDVPRNQWSMGRVIDVNPLSAKFTKWSNTLKQFPGKLPTNCLSVFDHFVGLTLKGLTMIKRVWFEVLH